MRLSSPAMLAATLLTTVCASTAVLAYDVVFNRDVLGVAGEFFANAAALAPLLDAAEADTARIAAAAASLQQRADERYNWDDVTDGYEQLAERLHAGESTRGLGRRTTRNSVPWEPASTVPATPSATTASVPLVSVPLVSSISPVAPVTSGVTASSDVLATVASIESERIRRAS